MIYLGIDPGKNGGIGLINPEANKKFLSRPFSEEELIHILKSFKSLGDPIICELEKVGARPGQGVVSMFNFGTNYGFIQGVLKSFEIPFELVTPQKWKKEFSVTSDKNTSIEVCKRLFPGIDLKKTPRCTTEHDGMAEALLIAEHCRRRNGNT